MEGTNGQILEAHVVEPKAELAVAAPTPVDLLRIAVTQGADIDKLEKLMGLQERWEANEARKAYVAAMKKFKENPPTLTKNKTVSFPTSSGQTTYKHTTLDHACDEIIKGLSAVGITHAWKMKQAGTLITVICILTHELGHSEETELSGGPDNSGGKNSIQAISSTVTYLQRYTLLAGTGLASKNSDNDGRGDTSAANRLDAEKVEEYCRQMNDVETAKDLQAVFAKSFGEASALNDMAAMASLTRTKNKRKQELAGGSHAS